MMRFAVFVGFELERSLVLVAFDGMEDDVSIVIGLPLKSSNDGDFNVRGRRRGLVFAAVVGVVFLSAQTGEARDETK